jgi:hypothetical protein
MGGLGGVVKRLRSSGDWNVCTYIYVAQKAWRRETGCTVRLKLSYFAELLGLRSRLKRNVD